MTFYQPGLTIALALCLGMLAQALAHHLRIPGIVLLLAAGVLLGPDMAGIIHPESLGPGLNILTGFAVAVILFEGGLNLKFKRLKRARHSIRQLILVGGIVTITGAAVAAHYVMDWPWKTALLFGTLVMVTGPTVINPLLKRLKVRGSVATVLEAEGVLIDAVGAVVAIVALETALEPIQGSPLVWGWHAVSRIGFGAGYGTLAALMLIVLYRVRRLIPEGTENVFMLSVVFAVFQTANLILPESGIAAVTAAGIVVGNLGTRWLQELLEFKEELTVMLIAMLFVLLAADVRVAQVISLGWPALGLVLVLMFLVRPLAVMMGTGFSELGWKEKIFVAWIGPRGIVAAAVASLFATTLEGKGLEGGYELRAMVFLVIAVTVVFAGLTGGFMARLLGLQRPSQSGWVFLGANALARAMAKLFREDGQEVVCIDSNDDHCRAAENDCTRVIFGNGLQARNLLRSEIDTRRGAVALTANDEVNYLFLQKVREEVKTISLYTTLKTDTTSLTTGMVHQAGADLLFGRTADVDNWNRRFMNQQVLLQIWQFTGDQPPAHGPLTPPSGYSGNGLIGAAVRKNGRLTPVGDSLRVRKGDIVYFFVFMPDIEFVENFLLKAGWEKDEAHAADREAFSTSICYLD